MIAQFATIYCKNEARTGITCNILKRLTFLHNKLTKYWFILLCVYISVTTLCKCTIVTKGALRFLHCLAQKETPKGAWPRIELGTYISILVGEGRACAPVRCAHPSFWAYYHTKRGAARPPPPIAASLHLIRPPKLNKIY